MGNNVFWLSELVSPMGLWHVSDMSPSIFLLLIFFILFTIIFSKKNAEFCKFRLFDDFADIQQLQASILSTYNSLVLYSANEM